MGRTEAAQTEPMLVNTGSVDNPVPISQAMLDGYAPGNELYTFTEYPRFSEGELANLSGASYADTFYSVTKKLLGDAMPDSVLRSTADQAYSPTNFDFDPQDHSLRFTTLRSSGIHIVGLSDGPTGAFKDMAMQPFGRWMSHLLETKNKSLTILLSTSGDTGPAALNAFGDLPNTEIINMLPTGGVSPFQWSQMAELSDEAGVHILEVDGKFSKINKLQLAAELAYDLGAVNSANIARIIAQIPYHVAAYLKAIELEGKSIGDPVDIAVPSGNFGNGLSAIIARKMGVPIRNIILATNENNTLDTLFRTGNFEIATFVGTDSSAQDVEMPSNAWRYFAMLYGNDTEKIAAVYKRQQAVGSVAIRHLGIVDQTVLDGVLSATVSKADRALAMRIVYGDDGVMIDPHTANGLVAIAKLHANADDVPMVTMETAKPFKFGPRMLEVLGVEPPRPDRFVGLEERQAGKQLTQIAGLPDLLEYIATQTKAPRKITA